MKAIVHFGSTELGGLSYNDIDMVQPGSGDVLVKLKAAGLNHRDLFLMKARTEQDAPLILGSDGAGTIVEVGEGGDKDSIGKDVVLNPTLNWPITDEVPELPVILGSPSEGTFAEYVVVAAQQAVEKPAYLTWEEAGVLPLAALTAYRALFTRGELKAGQHVLIPGIGSGVATYALLMAKAAGAHVTVTSRSEYKREMALKHGADLALDSQEDWSKALHGEKVDLVIDSIGPATFSKYFDVVKSNGRIVTFGASSGDVIQFPIRALFFPQISIIGTSMGSSEEFAAMLRYMNEHAIRPVIDRMYPLEETVLAFQRMKNGEQFGNIGLIMG
ncbi:zinc-binding dehydrogenase [Paenibacillus sp. UMB4589-SE434]|uniref:quinone oxidoreductase family protein n=1 Tax=Paenibacillus sp. UMB4589-SE434 TaxID=3046314 RepID=UPI00254A687E|nr:zinc-binding dehydrogenase [Paenibacillus sp. UMB4589-SE434]MDK8179785.1 zinc-binding dehydrogenase [Paenibacillus sp. UMB4589-SE434]